MAEHSTALKTVSDSIEQQLQEFQPHLTELRQMVSILRVTPTSVDALAPVEALLKQYESMEAQATAMREPLAQLMASKFPTPEKPKISPEVAELLRKHDEQLKLHVTDLMEVEKSEPPKGGGEQESQQKSSTPPPARVASPSTPEGKK